MDEGVGAAGGGCDAAGAGDAAALCANVLRELMQRPGYAHSDAELLAGLRGLYGLASAVEAAKLMFVAELQGRPGVVTGARPGRAAHTFLTEGLRVSGAQANRDVAAAVALASASPELPLMAQALADGLVHREHVDVGVSTLRRLPKKLKQAVVEVEPDLLAEREPEQAADAHDASEAAQDDQAADPAEETQGAEQGAEQARLDAAEPRLMTGAQLIDQILTREAQLLPPPTVDRLGRHIVHRLDPDRGDRFDPEAVERRTCSIGTDFAGMGIYRLIVDPATHLQLRALIARFAAPRPSGNAVDESGAVVPVKDRRTLGQRQADAMTDLMFAGAATQQVSRDADEQPRDVGEQSEQPRDVGEQSEQPGDVGEQPRDADEQSGDAGEPSEHPRDAGHGEGRGHGGRCGAAFFFAPPVVAAELTLIATLDQLVASFGGGDPAARAAGLARMGLAGTVGDFAGASVHPEVLARLACDCPIRRIVVDDANVPLHHGRARRFASTAQRRALAVRDGGCVVPGCPAPPEWTEAHHLVPWERGGLTDVGAMVLLCSRHHTAHHAGVYDIELRDGRAWVRVPAWQDVRRPWLANISATHGDLADRVARVIGAQRRLPFDGWNTDAAA